MKTRRFLSKVWLLLAAAGLTLSACGGAIDVPGWFAALEGTATAELTTETEPSPTDAPATDTSTTAEPDPTTAPTATPPPASPTPSPEPTSPPEPTATTPPTATPAPTAVPVRIRSGMADMLLVPAATFDMGADPDTLLAECERFMPDCDAAWFGSSEPVHTVTVDSFYLDATEVTNEAYSAFLNELGDHLAACDDEDCLTLADSALVVEDGRYTHTSDLADHPVTGVTWFGADAYCAWRDARLPTEAEWERAAGWDIERQTKRLYPWGDTFEGTAANTCDTTCTERQAVSALDDGAAATAAVGSYPDGRSPVGAFDMAGNVWEWVADWFGPDYYANSPDANPIGPDTGEVKVVRGGSWFDTANFTAVAVRFPAPPTESGDSIGFRCARELGAAGEIVVVEPTAVAIAAALDEPEQLPDGDIKLSGTGEPGSELELLNNDELIDTVMVDEDGTWTLTASFDAATHEIGVRTAGADEPADTLTLEITPEPTPTATASPTATPTIEPTTTPTVEPTTTPTPSPTAPSSTPAADDSDACVGQPGVDLGDRYIVGQCEYLRLIARKLNISYEALLLANPQITNPDLVVPGQVILLPPRDGASATPPPPPPGSGGDPSDPGSGLNG